MVVTIWQSQHGQTSQCLLYKEAVAAVAKHTCTANACKANAPELYFDTL